MDMERFAAAWKHCKIKVAMETFIEVYEHYPEVYKHERLNSLTPEEIQSFSGVFHFTAATLSGCKNQLIRFISQYKEFYHDEVNVMIQKMEAKVTGFHQQFPNHPNITSIIYVNWLPLYGGIILNRKAAFAEKREVFENTGPLPIWTFWEMMGPTKHPI